MSHSTTNLQENQLPCRGESLTLSSHLSIAPAKRAAHRNVCAEGGRPLYQKPKPKGVTLLFVMLILAVLLSMAVGIFNSVFGQIRLSGEITDSFVALYAADQGMEKLFYQDRVADSIPGCSGSGNCSYSATLPSFSSGACAILRLTRVSRATTLVSTGEYRCGGGETVVRRSFQATYKK